MMFKEEILKKVENKNPTVFITKNKSEQKYY